MAQNKRRICSRVLIIVQWLVLIQSTCCQQHCSTGVFDEYGICVVSYFVVIIFIYNEQIIFKNTFQAEDQVGAILQTPCRYGYNIDHTGRCRKMFVWNESQREKGRMFSVSDYESYYLYDRFYPYVVGFQ